MAPRRSIQHQLTVAEIRPSSLPWLLQTSKLKLWNFKIDTPQPVPNFQFAIFRKLGFLLRPSSNSYSSWVMDTLPTSKSINQLPHRAIFGDISKPDSQLPAYSAAELFGCLKVDGGEKKKRGTRNDVLFCCTWPHLTSADLLVININRADSLLYTLHPVTAIACTRKR